MSMEMLEQTLDTMPDTGSNSPDSTTDANVATPNTAEPTTTEPSETTPPDEATSSPFKPEDIFSPNDKQNAAWARMRTENKQYHDTMAKLGSILGINPEDPEALVKGVNDQILTYQSQQNKIPVELLRDLEETKNRLAMYEQSHVKEQALLAFQKVKDNYSLSDAQLEKFAMQLRDNGIDPFQTAVDLDKEYWNFNRESLIKQIKDQTTQEVLEKQAHAAEHSSTPSKSKGVKTPAAQNNMAALDSLLASFPNSK